MPDSPHLRPFTTAEPIDPKAIRQHIRMLIRHQFSQVDRNVAHQTHVVLNEIWHVVEYANRQLQEETYAQALLTLKAVTDVCSDQWMYLNDFHGEVHTFFEDLAGFWTEVLLSHDLTTKERNRWLKQLAIWQTRLAEMHMFTVFDAPQTAIREGWDYPPLQDILQGKALLRRDPDDEMSRSNSILIQARLAILEKRNQDEEYLRLAWAENQTRAYITMAVRQGQITEAINYGWEHLTTSEDTFAFVQALFAQKEHEHCFQIALYGLTLKGNRVPLATWLRDHAWSMGHQIIALEAGEVAFYNEPTLKQYQRVIPIAGDHWHEVRDRLLEYARHAPFTVSSQGLVHLFLYEHLFTDAIEVLKADTSYTLVAQIVDATLEEQTELEWVIQACREQAEHIMNGAKASYYQAASTWLRKAHTAYHLLERDEIWQDYLHELVERHHFKSKLLPLLTSL